MSDFSDFTVKSGSSSFSILHPNFDEQKRDVLSKRSHRSNNSDVDSKMTPNRCRKKLLVAFGALSGWITSLLVLKVGKAFAFIIGSAIVFMEFNSEDNFLTVDWENINDEFGAALDYNIRSKFVDACGEMRQNESGSGATKYSTFLFSFIGGVLLAIGSH
ncbi:hypothetical protein FQR65_LT08028 [Abscondita terminalis]|nr:hypothetical protein FQR65_LT08028 [Abscondita terminalis]